MMGTPDWTQVELFKDTALRAEHQQDGNKLIEVWTQQYTMAEIDRLGIEYDVPLAPVRTVREVVNDEQLAYREFFVEIDHPAAGKLKYPGAPYRLAAAPWEVKRPAPLLGEHNEEVYGRMLGYGKKDIVGMEREGLI
jgi:crotonobetainyl-CoA:carnitine CoA-transferase CaiB-like acyl-CoA transferase